MQRLWFRCRPVGYRQHRLRLQLSQPQARLPPAAVSTDIDENGGVCFGALGAECEARSSDWRSQMQCSGSGFEFRCRPAIAPRALGAECEAQSSDWRWRCGYGGTRSGLLFSHRVGPSQQPGWQPAANSQPKGEGGCELRAPVGCWCPVSVPGQLVTGRVRVRGCRHM